MLAYRCLITLFAAAVLWRARRDGTWRDRLARGAPVPDAPHLWWHGASNGELASARPVLTALLAARPDLHVVVTANTATGVALVRGWGLARVTVRPAPVDLARVTARALRRWRVTAHVTLESELWPHRILACPGPVIVLGARMSAGTARSWARLPRLAARVLGRVAFAAAQDPASRDRLRQLGLPAGAAGPVVDLKALYAPPKVPAEAIAGFDRGRTWLAASTHPGEEAVVIAAHLQARAHAPGLRLILAPRHPARADAIAGQIAAAGLTVARRSRDEPPTADVYLADTMGEMALWYAAAGRVFVGGTLSDRGGHTPYEPAAFGAALLHGPDVANFAAAYARLAGHATPVTDADSLAEGLRALHDPARQRDAGRASAAALATEADADALCAAVLRHLHHAAHRP